ncbi:MAG: peptidyl-tRNA hydrolase [Actinomycetota bacterium]
MSDVDEVEAVPRAMQLAVRIEKAAPPTTAAVCAATALATISLLDDARSQPGGEWHGAVSAWNGERIRKIVRRGRGSPWRRAQEPAGVTVARDGAEVRAYVPSRVDDVPEPVSRLQIQSTPLDEADLVDQLPELDGLLIAVTPSIEMSWGKRAAQSAHAGQWAWMRSDPEVVGRWDRRGRPIVVVHPTERLWAELTARAPVQIHDGGFTEVPAGTKTAVAWWGSAPG